MGKKKENKMQFITIDMDTWNRFTRCIFDINKELDDNIIINYGYIEKILKDNKLRIRRDIDEKTDK
ncbi:MAG: hypothetical protein IKS48_06140 [Eubacterium sp.]|nr:hypothetical protein [Eubacterium sp.]